jgi:lipopolysaccharide transport system permease protein
MLSTQTAHRRIWQPLWQLPGRADLILSFAKRELLGRYKGSALGIAWAVLTPVVMIAVFTFIFAGIFGARFGVNQSHWDYALYLFCGLLPWSMFQESVQQSSNTIVSNANLVKRVVFPLEALPAAQVFAALGNQLFATVALLIATIIVRQRLEITAIWLPVLLIPQILFALGAAWLIASLGVFLRDIAQGVTLLLMAWMYLTPIIYPESIVPENFRSFIELNPFTPLIRNYRKIFLDGLAPDWRGLAYFTLFAAVIFLFGYWWFARTRKSFADVV